MNESVALYLIRHGQTAWNREGRLQGGRNSPLTERGRQQAEAAATGLRATPPASILSSPLGRACETAAIIGAGLGLQVETDERLGELRFGDCEGMTLAELDAQWPGFRERRESDKWSTRWPNGESYADADARIETFLRERLAARMAGPGKGALAIVGHETINMVLLGRLLALEPSTVTRIGQPNPVIYRVQDGLADHAHLGDGRLDWIPGILQKRSDDIIHAPPPVFPRLPG